MSARSKEIAKECGVIVLGMLLMAIGGGKIISALLLGKTAIGSIVASFADQPLLFVVLLAVWSLVVATGVSSLARGVARVRQVLRGSDATQ